VAGWRVNPLRESFTLDDCVGALLEVDQLRRRVAELQQALDEAWRVPPEGHAPMIARVAEDLLHGLAVQGVLVTHFDAGRGEEERAMLLLTSTLAAVYEAGRAAQ